MNNQNKSGGIGCVSLFTVLLSIVFITLKITGTIDWSWWWVLAPIWIYAAIFVLLFGAIGVIALIECIDNRKEK